MNLGALIKTKTFWVGVLTIAAAVIDAAFTPGGWGQIWNDQKLWIGLTAITGRGAILKGLAK